MRCSIVIATHNHETYLRHVLHSIRVQNVPFDFEVVIVDDGSDKPEVIEELCSSYSCILIQLPQKGYYGNPSKARNIGLKRATGDVLICQSDEVVHHSWNTIELLVNSLVPGTFIIANVWNGLVDENGSISTSEIDPVLRIKPNLCYTGSDNKRPFFFLGSVFRKDIYSIGGNDEDFNEPGFDDNWLASCLENGAHLRAVYFDDIKGFHLDHPRIDLGDSYSRMRALFEAKCRQGVYCSSGGPWKLTE